MYPSLKSIKTIKKLISWRCRKTNFHTKYVNYCFCFLYSKLGLAYRVLLFLRVKKIKKYDCITYVYYRINSNLFSLYPKYFNVSDLTTDSENCRMYLNSVASYFKLGIWHNKFFTIFKYNVLLYMFLTFSNCCKFFR